MVDGVVKKIDKAGGKVTVAHGPLTNLNMPAMTMVFPRQGTGLARPRCRPAGRSASSLTRSTAR